MVISGDIANGSSVHSELRRIAGCFPGHVYYVLGNHDFYGSSMAEVNSLCAKTLAGYDNLTRLDGYPRIELADGITLLGVDGWACGTTGNGKDSRVMLNDFRLIEEFHQLKFDREKVFSLLHHLAHKSAMSLVEPLLHAASRSEHIIVVTHVPPYPEAAWYEEKMSEPDFLPHFCNAVLGKLLNKIASRYPKSQMTVLCGHTHGEGFYRRENVQVVSAKAVYGQPGFYRIFPEGFWEKSADEREKWHRSMLPPSHPAHKMPPQGGEA
jgi:3',5'-cyclic-AMP phosphodiesterase